MFVPSLFDTTQLTPNQQGVVSPINQGINSGNTTGQLHRLGQRPHAVQHQPGYFRGGAGSAFAVKFGSFTSVTAFDNATFDTEARDNYLADRRGGDHGTFLGGNGAIDTSGLTINDPSYDSALSAVHSRLLAWNPAPFNGAISDVAARFSAALT